jgi:urease subunit beta
VSGFFVPEAVIPGEVVLAAWPIVINAGRETRRMTVSNTGDRPIQVGSHFHFADTNTALDFDRAAADGFRLDVAAGTAVRFEPGVTREVVLVALGGARHVPGLQLRTLNDEGNDRV